MREGHTGPDRSAKFNPFGFKMWAYSPQIAKIVFLVKNSPNGVYPLKQFFLQNLARRGSPRSHCHANFHHCGFKNVALRPPKSPKIAIFGINLPLRKNPGGP